MEIPNALYLECPDCGQETLHEVLKGRGSERKSGIRLTALVKCNECGTIRPVAIKEEAERSVPAILSDAGQSARCALLLDPSSVVSVGDVILLGAGGGIETDAGADGEEDDSAGEGGGEGEGEGGGKRDGKGGRESGGKGGGECGRERGGRGGGKRGREGESEGGGKGDGEGGREEGGEGGRERGARGGEIGGAEGEGEGGGEGGGEGMPVLVTAIEVGTRRVPRAKAASIATVWLKRYDKVKVKVSVNTGRRTISREFWAAPEERFEVGDILTVGDMKVLVHSLNTGGRKLKRGAAPAKGIRRIYGREVE